MERIDAESRIAVMLIEGSPILRLRRLVGMIILLTGALALLLHGPGLMI